MRIQIFKRPENDKEVEIQLFDYKDNVIAGCFQPAQLFMNFTHGNKIDGFLCFTLFEHYLRESK